jgi:hypothetical protein
MNLFPFTVLKTEKQGLRKNKSGFSEHIRHLAPKPWEVVGLQFAN